MFCVDNIPLLKELDTRLVRLSYKHLAPTELSLSYVEFTLISRSYMVNCPFLFTQE